MAHHTTLILRAITAAALLVGAKANAASTMEVRLSMGAIPTERAQAFGVRFESVDGTPLATRRVEGDPHGFVVSFAEERPQRAVVIVDHPGTVGRTNLSLAPPPAWEGERLVVDLANARYSVESKSDTGSALSVPEAVRAPLPAPSHVAARQPARDVWTFTASGGVRARATPTASISNQVAELLHTPRRPIGVAIGGRATFPLPRARGPEAGGRLRTFVGGSYARFDESEAVVTSSAVDSAVLLAAAGPFGAPSAPTQGADLALSGAVEADVWDAEAGAELALHATPLGARMSASLAVVHEEADYDVDSRAEAIEAAASLVVATRHALEERHTGARAGVRADWAPTPRTSAGLEATARVTAHRASLETRQDVTCEACTLGEQSFATLLNDEDDGVAWGGGLEGFVGLRLTGPASVQGYGRVEHVSRRVAIEAPRTVAALEAGETARLGHDSATDWGAGVRVVMAF